jgi:hypothetical protein
MQAIYLTNVALTRFEKSMYDDHIKATINIRANSMLVSWSNMSLLGSTIFIANASAKKKIKVNSQAPINHLGKLFFLKQNRKTRNICASVNPAFTIISIIKIAAKDGL